MQAGGNTASPQMIRVAPIPNWPGYRALTDGRIQSSKLGTWTDLKTSIHKQTGYPHVRLHADGKGKTFRVYKLILLAFRGPCPPGMEACHNDGNPQNSRLGNLRWDTKISNAADRRRSGEGLRALAREFKISPGTASLAANGKTWKGVS